MKLYLTSNGLENDIVSNRFKTLISSKDPKGVSFLVISVQDSERDAFYLQKTKNELNKIGFTNIDVLELKEKEFNTDKEYDVIYVCGGNTFVYLDRIRKTGLDKFIIDSVKSNRSIYVGVSAGSIVAGPSIVMTGWGSECDPNDIGLQDLEGLNLTDIVIYPHYRKELKSEIDDFKKKYDFKVEEVEDNQAILLNYSNVGNLKDVLSKEHINYE